MANDKPFKVVIIGGSVAGLVLGNMLQLNGIDFIILEAYPKIAPQVGASIGLLPNGNRILDQLGLFDTILGLAPPVEKFNFRNSKGERIAGHSGMRNSFVQRHGYPILFLDRQSVLQVLYDNIRDKSKVITEKRLVKVDMNEKGILATMTDGSEFSGDVLVGGDGIYSTVRSEMWRLANERAPGYIPAGEHKEVGRRESRISILDENPLLATTVVSLAFQTPLRGLNLGICIRFSAIRTRTSSMAAQKAVSIGFYLFKNPQTFYGPDIPRYTKEDEAKVLKEHENDPITPEISFKVLQERKITSTLTALPEYVYKKWYYERIVTIGDSAHKFNPIGGHGGNAAFETSAAFVNSLELRESRVTTLKDASHEQQRTEAMEDSLHKFIALTLLPITDTEDVMFNFSGNQPYAEKLDMVELPPRPKLIPYKDELANPPALRGSVGWWQMLLYVFIAISAYYGMWVRSKNEGLADQFAAILRSPRLAAKSDDSLGMLSLYFFGVLIQPVSIWLVEACRKRNDMNLVAMPTVWFALSQWLALVLSYHYSIRDTLCFPTLSLTGGRFHV
ncbi:hypothetical protein DID88_004193 [Monilinia fructigena]|uniref:FAD-binding domain-containing protein n=1 Tax=Monilinia fructigena TaxID=38457 RepID=A0A395IXP1_9HELO|nr:hypothetical protein DID88_004193 [Monilinia fructigena]